MIEHTPAPWTDTTYVMAVGLAGGVKVLLNGKPPQIDCRVMSEGNYQHAKHCVNAHADLLTACEEALKVSEDAEWAPHQGLPDATEAILRAAIAKGRPRGETNEEPTTS